jgi:rhodanese-related sulfurtransferase
VDVREPPVVASSSLVAGAINLTRSFLQVQADLESPTHRADLAQGYRLVLYCRSGARWALVAKDAPKHGN